MTYAYIRVSSDKQTVENQRLVIKEYAKKNEYSIDSWISETISGTRRARERKLGKLLKKLKKNDTLITTEISRLGRSLMEVMSILNHCIQRGVIVISIKEKYELSNNIQSQIIAFAFSLSAQIERDLISMRTKEGLARRKAEGAVLGRPVGSKNKKHKLSGKEEQIRELLEIGVAKTKIARMMNVHVNTLYRYMNEQDICE